MESDNTEEISQPEVVGNKGKYAPNTYELATKSRVNQVAAPKDLTELGESDLDSILSAPLTGEEVALKIQHLRENGVELSPDNISFDEHNAYREWMDKQHFNFMGAVADGFGQAAKDVVGGVWDAATDWKKLALGTGLSIATANPVVGYGVAYGASLLEGFARGTRDLGGLAVMAANHPDSPIYRLLINPTGDKRQLYQDFFDLAAWNDQSERIISGQSNLLMPERATYEKLLGRAMGDQIDDFIGVNKSLATASAYILDPTLYFSLGASTATKATAKVATAAGVAALKAGHAGQALAHGVAARAVQTTWKASVLNSAGSVLRKTSDVITKPLEKLYAKVEQMAGDVMGTRVAADARGNVKFSRSKVGKGPASFNSAVLGAAGVYSLFSIPYGAAITGIYTGAKALGFAGDILSAIGKNVTEHGLMGSAEILAQEAKLAGRPVAGAIGNALVGSSVIGGYMADLGKVMAHGSLYGGAIGYVAGGKEGAAGGIGTGLFLGAAGHNYALAHGTISGKFAKANMINEFKNHTSYLKEQGHLLKAENMEKFIDMIQQDHGEDEGIRRLGQLMMAEKSKNLVLSILSTEDMIGALQSDPNFVRTENGVKVLTDAGKVLRDQINAAQRPSGVIKGNESTGRTTKKDTAWNGAFVTLDANGNAHESPVLNWKDKSTGKHHIIINMDALRMERNADGTLVKKKHIVKPAVYQTVEGERPATAQTAPAKIASKDDTNGVGDYGIPMKKGSRASRRVVEPKGEKARPMEGPMPPVERLVSPEESFEYVPAKTAPSAIISEMFHQMNTVRRRAEIGTEVNSVVRNWLLGDQHKEGWAFTDRKGAVEFMTELYDRMGAGNRGNEAADWKLAISEYEQTGVMKPETLDKFQGFIEELGDTMFIGWESGKPFDFVAKGGDIGMARTIFESVKDVFANHALREATSMGADVRTKQSFAEWFTKTKAGGRFKFDPAIEKSFTDLIRIYNEKGMKNNGRTPVNVSKLSSAELLSHAQAYGYEERLKKNQDGTYTLKPKEEYYKERHEMAMVGMRQLAEAIELDPSVAEGIDFYITEDRGDSAGFDAAVKEQSTAEQESIDTIGRTKGFLYQSPDFSDIGVGLDDIVKAGVVTARKNNTWKQAKDAYGRPVNYGTGSRGRPRTAPSGKLGFEMKKAFEEGKTVVMRGIPNGKAFAIIERFITKQQRRNLALLAPIVADGGQTRGNVVRGDYLGLEQVQAGTDVTLSREKGDMFDARTMNFVPYNFELRLTLTNPKNPTVKYTSPHFTFNAKGYDIDCLTRRGQILWQENAEIRDQYVHLNEFMSHIYKTIDDYSVSNAIPATHFFGDDEGARTRRRYVVAALGAVPTVELKGNKDKGIVGIFSTYEADWHDSQMRNVLGKINHPWMDVKLDLLANPVLREGEGSQVRMNEKVYRRGQIPTPREGTTDLYKDANGRTMMYQSPDSPIDIDMENPASFYQHTQGLPLDVQKLARDSSDPSKLAKELGKMDMFKPIKRVALYQAADEVGASNSAEKKFLKSNYADAVEKGDIFLAESVKRFVRSTGENPVIVRHTIEEHLANGGNAETYVSAFESNKPTVVTATSGTTNRFVLLSKQLGKDVGSVAMLKGGKAPIFFGFTSDSYNQSITPPDSPTMRAAMVMRDSVGQVRSLLSFKNPLVLHNWELKTKGAETGAANSVSMQSLDFETIGNLAQSAKDLGHDGIILTDSVVGKKDAGNAMFIPLESDRQIAVIDTTMEKNPVPRNSGYKEGGQYMRQAADSVEPLPEGAFGLNNPHTVKISRQFKSSRGITAGDGKFIVKLNPDKSFKIGYQYEQMPHNPNNPLVKKAYEQFIKETIEQMHELQSQGYTAELNFTNENPYPNSQAVIASIRENKHLKVFSTDAGFGTNSDGTPKTITDADVKDNPLLAMSEFKDSNGIPMRINDVFRFVHDFFGHSERGNSFGPLGEENAWDVHSRMYSPLARRAMTTETRGQNSWVNFLNEDNKKTNAVRAEARQLRKVGKIAEADVLVNSVKNADVYAPQKIGLLPEWASKIDEEMSPIEREMFGTHQTSEGKYGMYQAADRVGDGVHPELEYTGMTKQTSGDIEYADAHLKYADFYREQLKKRENGEIGNDVALRMVLNTWIKNNINKKWDLRDTADILSKLPIGDGKFINVSEYTKEHRDSQVASLIRKDRNYIKDSKAEIVVAERADTVASIKETLEAEIASLDDPEQIESKKKEAVKAIIKAHSKKTLNWIDSLPPERKNKEARRALKTLGVEPRKAESWDDANKDSAARVKKEKEIEKIISRLNRENMDEINAGREAIYEENDIRSAAEMEWEAEKAKVEEDVSKMSPEDKEAYLAAQEEALQSGELSQEDYELQAQQRGGEGTKEPVSRKRAMINPPRSLEEHIVELGMEAEKARANGDEFALTEDEVIQMATRFHEMEVQAWEIWNRPEKRAGIDYGTIEAKGPIPTLVEIQKKYLNTEYFNNSGSSLMWKVGDKIYKGTEAEASKQAKKDGIKTGNLEAVYPPEMQAIVDSVNEKLKNIKAEDYNAVGIGTVLSLFQLWGWEVNKNLADKFFEPSEENINTVGMNESQAKKYRAEVRGKLIVRMTEEARLTQAIDAVPKFLDDVQSILTMAIGNMTDGVAESEVRAAGGQDLGSKLASIIKIDTNLKKEWIAEFARKNPDLMEVVFYRTKEEFVRDRMNNIDFKALPLELKNVIEPMLEIGVTPAQIKELVKAHLETSWEGQGKHPINQFFKPEGKNSEAFSIEKNIGKILRENNETLKRARSGVEVQKDAQGNVISYSNGLITEEQIAQQSRQEAYNARRSFIEFMFSKANDLILTESAKEERRPLTPAEIQEARRLEQKASQTQYDQPIGPKFEEVKPKEEKPEIPTANVPSTQQDETSASARINEALADISEDEPDYMRGVESIQMEPVTKKPSKPKATTTVEPPKAVADYKNPIGPEQPKQPKSSTLNPTEKLRKTSEWKAMQVIRHVLPHGGYLPEPLLKEIQSGNYTSYIRALKNAGIEGLSDSQIKDTADAHIKLDEYGKSKGLKGKEYYERINSEYNIRETVAHYERLDADKVEAELKLDKQMALDGTNHNFGMPEYNELVARLKKKGIIKPEVVKAQKIEKKINAQTNAVQTIKATEVPKPEVVGVKHAQVIKTGTVAAGSPEVAQAVSQVLQIKDDFTLNPATSHDTKGAWYSANKRYIAEPVRGNKGYRVTMLDHISPYDDKPLPKTMIGIVSSLEQAQLAIREHAFYQRRLFEMNNQKYSSGQGISEKLQSQAPVLTPQQTQQIAQQIDSTAQQQPVQPVVNPQVKAETHPRYNDIVRGLRGLGIPDAVLKDLTKKAIDNLGTDAKVVDVVLAVLNLSQGRALQVAQSNQTHTATANAHTEPVTLQTASQVVIMPTDAGTIAATGSVIPQLPIHFLVDATKTPEELAAIRQAQYNNKVQGIGLNPAFIAGAGDDKVTGRIKSRYPSADASTLATIRALTTFNGYNSLYSLPNGQKVNGKSYKNSLGYVIQQSGIGKWRLYNPAAAIVSVSDNEQEAVDKLIKHYYRK